MEIKISEVLKAQIASMVECHQDYVVDADGIDESVYTVVNYFADGVWLCAHNNECDMGKYTCLIRLDTNIKCRLFTTYHEAFEVYDNIEGDGYLTSVGEGKLWAVSTMTDIGRV